ncbi:MAG: EthD domain-containing protein [Steroidobacteraceae bacterium]|nr:EthD domain-containing protein [Steroidobacteraceae bacterium]MBP7012695.1 EthD domain-containing protein [Steroidobacteraceae bacterium]
MGWKMIYLARRNPALAPEQFPHAWREHSALGAGCASVRDRILSVAQCSRILEGATPPGTAADFDGVNLLSLRDLQAASDIWNDPETLAVMRPDEPRVFSTYVREFTLVCEERVLRDLTRSVFMFTQVTHSRP